MPPDPHTRVHEHALRYYHPAIIVFPPPQLKILYETLALVKGNCYLNDHVNILSCSPLQVLYVTVNQLDATFWQALENVAMPLQAPAASVAPNPHLQLHPLSSNHPHPRPRRLRYNKVWTYYTKCI